MIVVVDFFTVSHEDTAERDGLKGSAQLGVDTSTPELASQVHLTQVHDLVSRINLQLQRLSGEQRHFRGRCARNSFVPHVLPHPYSACVVGCSSWSLSSCTKRVWGKQACSDASHLPFLFTATADARISTGASSCPDDT